jgi:hypothetical protein
MVLSGNSGKEIMAFNAEVLPAVKDRERVGHWFSEVVRDEKGRIVSGYGLYGWKEGAGVHVVLLIKVPMEGAENRRYASHSPELRNEVLATYTIPIGEKREMTEMKTLGIKPASLLVERRSIR